MSEQSPGVRAYAVARKAGKGQLAAVKAYFAANPSRVQAIVQAEERQYFELLARAPETVRRLVPDGTLVDAATLARLWDEQGIDVDTACGILGILCDQGLHDAVRTAVQARQMGRVV